jgi:hypothetical protein
VLLASLKEIGYSSELGGAQNGTELRIGQFLGFSYLLADRCTVVKNRVLFHTSPAPTLLTSPQRKSRDISAKGPRNAQ